MTLGAAIARASHVGQNASCAVKKKRARPLERAPGTDHCVGDRTTTTPCLALPWTGSWFSRSLGLALVTACWPLHPVLSNISYSTVAIVRPASRISHLDRV